ncbi:hypothetical protein [Kribbella sp. VKM Ac-2568]|uniref:hypothetical protein n=1 Tax=Kribbella sp. VKM Ac-2568 TaxID=2512219 RepID=UPI00105254EF|nr:hypothetical protein [Kribbella sp. VKM Ac-2568]TCM38651.1 hypothetical protein EV648_116165 [Kribbella sp. VKM Ac-2568]
MTEHPGEQFPPAVDPDVEPGADPRTDEPTEPDYDSEPGPESMNSSGWVNPTLQARSHTDPLLAGFTMYGDPPPADDFLATDDSEQTFEASMEEEPAVEVEQPLEEAEVAPEPVEAAYEPEAPAQVKPAPVVPSPSPSPAVMARPGPPGGSQYQQTQYQSQPEPQYRQEPERVADDDGVHPLVEETMGRLDELRERPVGEHAEVYADLHERLQSALVEADAEHGDRA